MKNYALLVFLIFQNDGFVIEVRFIRVGSCEIKDFYVAMVRSTQKPNSSFVFFRLWVFRKTHLRFRCRSFAQLSYGGYQQFRAKLVVLLSTLAYAFFAQICPHFARQVRRTKPRFIRVKKMGERTLPHIKTQNNIKNLFHILHTTN